MLTIIVLMQLFLVASNAVYCAAEILANSGQVLIPTYNSSSLCVICDVPFQKKKFFIEHCLAIYSCWNH